MPIAFEKLDAAWSMTGEMESGHRRAKSADTQSDTIMHVLFRYPGAAGMSIRGDALRDDNRDLVLGPLSLRAPRAALRRAREVCEHLHRAGWRGEVVVSVRVPPRLEMAQELLLRHLLPDAMRRPVAAHDFHDLARRIGPHLDTLLAALPETSPDLARAIASEDPAAVEAGIRRFALGPLLRVLHAEMGDPARLRGRVTVRVAANDCAAFEHTTATLIGRIAGLLRTSAERLGDALSQVVRRHLERRSTA